jgi:hypothetical protein
MSTLFGMRQRAEELASRVDADDRAVRAVPGRPDAELERLVGLVASIRTMAGRPEHVAQVTAREDFVEDLRARLMTEAEHVLTPQTAALSLPTRRRGKRERRLVAVASAAVVLAGTAGVAAAAQSALPGQALYPLKRGIEQAQTSLAGSQTGKGHHLLDQADGRLDEVHGLLAERGAAEGPEVPLTLRQFSTQAREGSDLLLASYSSGGDPATVAAVRSFTARGITSLQALTQDAPVQAQDALRDAALTLRAIDQRASALCHTCSSLPALRVSPMMLASADASRALRRADAFEARLENDHPVVVPKAAVRALEQQQRSGGSSGSGSAGQTGSGTGGSVADAGSAVTAPVPAGPGGTPASAPSVPKVKVDLGATGRDVVGQTSKTLGSTAQGLGSTAQGLGDAVAGLGDSVSTLLPDPTSGGVGSSH